MLVLGPLPEACCPEWVSPGRSPGVLGTSSRAELGREAGRPTLGCVPAREPHAALSANTLPGGSAPSGASLLGSRGARDQERRSPEQQAGGGVGWPDRVLCPVFRLSFSDSESDNSADSCLPSREPPPSKKPPAPNSKVNWGCPGGPHSEEEGEEVVSWAGRSLPPPSCPGHRAEGCRLWSPRTRDGAGGGVRGRLGSPQAPESCLFPGWAAFRVRVRGRRTGARPQGSRQALEGCVGGSREGKS